MSPTPPRPSFSLSVWLLLLGCAGWLGWSHYARTARIEQITALPEWSVDAPVVQADSPTGYAHGWRRLILPESDYAGGQQIIRAQRVLAEGTWVNRQIAYENAPHGRVSQHASPGSWWLAALARADQAITGTPAGIAVERAALCADPLLHGLLLFVAWLVVRRSLGVISAALVVLALSAMFPFAGNFLAGRRDFWQRTPWDCCCSGPGSERWAAIADGKRIFGSPAPGWPAASACGWMRRYRPWSWADCCWAADCCAPRGDNRPAR
jgi:hypothetical protein